MAIIVGEEITTAKRNLKNIFPKEFSNRLLVKEYISYVLNNFFEKSKEKLVSAYVGEVVDDVDGMECYIKEPTIERQINQIIPVLDNGEYKITYDNFISDLHNEGVKVYNQNKMLSGKVWSWCPPIDVDMFINFTNYYWVRTDLDEESTIIIDGKINVETDVIGKPNYTYYPLDDEGNEIESQKVVFENGMRVIFTRDISGYYGNIPYVVDGINGDVGKIRLVDVKVPLIAISSRTNIVTDVLGQPTYNYVDPENIVKSFELSNGMRIMFTNDANEEYNNKIYIVRGVGESIELLDDSIIKEYNEPDYITMERGAIDGNEWSLSNRWVHKSALEIFNTNSIDSTVSSKEKYSQSLKHASMPIICFKKDIELYNSGTLSRGNVVCATELKSSELTGRTSGYITSVCKLETPIKTGDKVLFLGNESSKLRQLYIANILTDDKVIFQPCINGYDSDGNSVKGEAVNVLYGDKGGMYLVFDGEDWVEGQRKKELNQSPLFNLYDGNKISLDNKAEYPESTFNGCKLFDYSINMDKDVEPDVVIGKPLVDKERNGNYEFTNHLNLDKFYCTRYNEYQKEITGYKFFKINGEDSYENDWHLNDTSLKSYIMTRVIASDDTRFGEVSIDGISKVSYTVNLKYEPSDNSVRKPIIIYNNGVLLDASQYAIDGTELVILGVKKDNVLIIKLITDDVFDELDSDYVYEQPLSLMINQTNKEIEKITYNNCFDQMIDIIQNQAGLIGKPSGSSNFYNIKQDLSLGTKIVQHSDSIIRTMILNDDFNSSVRASIEYAMDSYSKFKMKFLNILDKMYQNGENGVIKENEGNLKDIPSEADKVITKILDKINIGKSGLQPFYNNGVIHIIENAYIPATPAYLGIAPCQSPNIDGEYEKPSGEKVDVIIGHDGSYYRKSNTVKDIIINRLEQLIYNSINSRFKENIVDSSFIMSGKFYKTEFTIDDVKKTYSTFVDLWANKYGLDYGRNDGFDYDDWRTWNYTDTIDCDGEKLTGSYRAVYMYYYGTYKPHTCPWEMLGFVEKPSWWENQYGIAPYTSSNIKLWSDIENGVIVDGLMKGEYKHLKRKGLVDRFIPVDNMGNLKSPLEIGIIKNKPLVQNAKRGWKIGDIGDIELSFMQTSEYRFVKELTKYLLRPVEWVEHNWDTINREVLFKDTEYEQVIDKITNTREQIDKIKLHNEYIDDKYVRNIGIQQWISDYLTYNKISISNIADRIRNCSISLGYRCSGYYQDNTVSVVTDSYNEIPENNIHLSVFKTKQPDIYTYSAIVIEKTRKGYIIDGFDKSYPYFTYRLPKLNGKKSSIDFNGKTLYYHNEWTNNTETIAYRTEITSVQELYTIINGYGKYLEENENWYFSTRTPDGEISDFRLSSETFGKWATLNDIEEGSILVLNPGSIGIGNNIEGLVCDLSEKVGGCPAILDINGHPIDSNKLNVFRQSYNTYIRPMDGDNIGLLKLRSFKQEHLLTMDNKTVYGDELYNSLYSSVIGRFKLSGVKVLSWYGDAYTPGYIIEGDRLIPNFEKDVNDVRYMFNVDDVHCQGDLAKYSRDIVGYKKTAVYKNLLLNDKSMFDFYKGSIRHKGTKDVLNRINRSTLVSSTGNNIEIYENWAFKAGEYGHTKDNSVIEINLDESKMKQNPQIVTFETGTNYYYDENNVYSKGDMVIYANTEYMAKESGITGKFNLNKWKVCRYVGNYIVFWDDKKWLKKPTNQNVGMFRYTNDITFNPIGGTASVDECDYIVATEYDFDEIKDDITIGETVWLVKDSNGDWDVRRKASNNRFVSLRYKTIEELETQRDYDFVYHFVDNGVDYYTRQHQDEILLNDEIYSDIELLNQVGRWKDITKPEYTGNVFEYPVAVNHRLKLYNTIFETTVEEDNLNSETMVKEVYGDSTLTYSNLLLEMIKNNHTKTILKYPFKLKVDTEQPNVVIKINGTRFYNPLNNTVEMVVMDGEKVEWEVTADNCGSRSGIAYASGEYLLDITVKLSMRNGTILVDSSKATESSSESFVNLKYPGTYEVKLVGAGGGAGGASWKKHHKHEGNGGGAGAYIHGRFTLDNTFNYKKPFKYVIGEGGKGGKADHAAGDNGFNGIKSYIMCDNQYLFIAGPGIGGKGSRGHKAEKFIDWTTGKARGSGGVFAPTNPTTTNEYSVLAGINNLNITGLSNRLVLNDSVNGNSAKNPEYNANPATSVYNGNIGAGGDCIGINNGNNGFDGYVYIEMISGEIPYDDTTIISKKVSFVSKQILKSDAYDYSVYYQPYVVKPDANPEYFYSYDVIGYDENRPDANSISSQSSFYKNRSRMISAPHNTNVIINQYTNYQSYSVGEKVTYDGKYYICIKDFVAGATFDASKFEEYWETYYYKITYNGDSYTEDVLGPKAEYELYIDSDCTIRAKKDSTSGSTETDLYMTCADLITTSAKLGSTYRLVDKFATYSELTPKYIYSPEWTYSITDAGTYRITSGNREYYVKMDKETTERNKDSLVYNDINCIDVAKKVVSRYENSKATYNYEDLKYSELSEYEKEIIAISYELKDGDILLYTSKLNGELNPDDMLYIDYELKDEANVYSYYAPKWDNKRNANNGYYENNVKYNGVYNGIIELVDNNDTPVSAYYREYSKDGTRYELKPLFAISVSNNGLVDYDNTTSAVHENEKIKLYTDKDEQITSILKVKNVESLDTKFFAKDYTEETLNQSSVNTQNNVVELYGVEECVGEHIESRNIVTTLSNETEMYLMNTVYDEDQMREILDSIITKILSESIPLDVAIDISIEEFRDKGYFFDKDEVVDAFNSIKDIGDYPTPDNYRKVFGKHVFQEAELYIPAFKDSKEYTYLKLYKYGNTYYKKEVCTNASDMFEVAIKLGNIDEVASYKKGDIIIDKVYNVVNQINYKMRGDIFYIDNDCFAKRNTISEDLIISDSKDVMNDDGLKTSKFDESWIKLEYVKKECKYDTIAVERKKIDINQIKSCFLVDNNNDSTIIKVQPYDPIQNVLPNEVFNELNYISSSDPVTDYEEYGKWGDNKIGYLWWDTSKVRYVDYYQGDIEYRRTNWGKQLPGSEIAIMEWTRSVMAPTDDRKYITKEVFDYETSSNITYYYFWEKNVNDVPNVPFRKRSALNIANIINNPSEEGIVWFAPISINKNDSIENSLILCNFNSVMIGQDCVLQINMDSDIEIDDHTEWAMVREKADSEIPDFLWQKLKDSLLGTKTIDDINVPVPAENLEGRERLGIGFRPRQTMFANLYNARENFVDIVNDVFSSRGLTNLQKDIRSSLMRNVDTYKGDYYDKVYTKLELLNLDKYGLDGQLIYVEQDESLNNIWSVYKINNRDIELVDYQRYNIMKYLTLEDWYENKFIKNITPKFEVKDEQMAEQYKTMMRYDDIIKCETVDGWKLKQLQNNNTSMPYKLVGQEKVILKLSDKIYNYINDDLKTTKDFIICGKEELSEFDYVYNETQYLIEKILDYFDEDDSDQYKLD